MNITIRMQEVVSFRICAMTAGATGAKRTAMCCVLREKCWPKRFYCLSLDFGLSFITSKLEYLIWQHNMVSVSLRNPNFAQRPTWNKASHNSPENNLIILHFIYHFIEQYWTTLKMKNQSKYNEMDVLKVPSFSRFSFMKWRKANICLQGRKRKCDYMTECFEK